MDTSRTHLPTLEWQRVLNSMGARRPARRFDPPLPVTVRLVWERDGEEWVDTAALGWSGELGYIQLWDRRWHANAIWLAATDIERRDRS